MEDNIKILLVRDEVKLEEKVESLLQRLQVFCYKHYLSIKELRSQKALNTESTKHLNRIIIL